MDLKQCWSHYLKAKKCLTQGHWPEAYYLFDDVLRHLPTHLQRAVQDDQTQPCQLVCLIAGLKETAISQADILNSMGQPQQAYQALNQTYALLQFLSIETTELIQLVAQVFDKHSNDLLEQINIFCHTQRSASWQLEYANVEKAHRYFTQLKYYQGLPCDTPVLN